MSETAVRSLVGGLEELRERYGQRQRLVNGLLAAFKGAGGALGKAQKALQDYRTLTGEQAPASLSAAQEALAGLRFKESVAEPLLPELRRELKQLGPLVAALKDAQGALRAESADVVRLGRAIDALKAARVSDDLLSELLPELDHELGKAQEELGFTFGETLRAALTTIAVPIGGRPPRFELGRFELNVNFARRSATLAYGKDMVLPRLPLSVEAIVKAYEREAKAIMGRGEDPARWVEQFYTAWERARSRRETPDQRANIVDCYYELVLLRQARGFHAAPSKRAFLDYNRAQFAYDFFEYAQRQRRDHKGMRVFGHVATKSQADNPDKSFWIVEGDGPHDGRYIADVVFSRDE